MNSCGRRSTGWPSSSTRWPRSSTTGRRRIWPLGDRVLVPVPDAGVPFEVVRRVRGIEHRADPAQREKLVHEQAVRAVERELRPAVGPVVRLVRPAESPFPVVAALENEALPGPAGVHAERDLLVVFV